MIERSARHLLGQGVQPIFLDSFSHLPRPAGKNIAVHPTPAAERALREGHPWLFGDAIRRQSHEGAAGDLAVVFDRQRNFLAVGLYDPYSPLRVRVLHQGAPATIDEEWFRRAIAAALARREPLHNDPQTTGYRLIHGENDGLPGLVLDRYGGTGVLKLYTSAWFAHLRPVVGALLGQFPLRRLVLRLSRNVQETETFGLKDGEVLLGDALNRPLPFLEHGLQFAADVVQGQKTGFFFDQRENRARVETLAAGRRVLNLFAYTGAFSLYAARGGATAVLSVDSSQPALAEAHHNFERNQEDAAVAAAEHEVLVADVFVALRDLGRARRRFGMVIVDPPALATNSAEVSRALAAYERLVTDALEVLRPGGVLAMASCTGRVTAEVFFDLVLETARQAGRELVELARTGHALDHPVTFKEGAYLKCLFAEAL